MKTRRSSRTSASTEGSEGDGDLEDRGRQRVTRSSSNASAKDSPPAPSKKPRRSSRLSPGSEQKQSSPLSKDSTPLLPTKRRTRSSPPSDDGTPTPKTQNKGKAKENSQKTAAASTAREEVKISEEKKEAAENDPSPKTDPKNNDAKETNEAKTNEEVQEKDESKDKDGSTKDDADESSSHPPPIKEVITSETSKSNKPTRHTRSRSGPKLDEKTLTMIKSHFDESKEDVLDEDEVINFTLRMTRAANQQTRLQLVLASAAGGRAADKEIYDYPDDQQSDAGSNDTSIFADCLAEEEEHAVGHDLMKKLHSKFQPNNKSSSKSTGGSKSSMDKNFDKKTFLWVKRAAGLHRHSGDDTAVVPQPSTSKGGRMTTRHATRKLVTDRREKKREKGLDILAEALNELEGQYGPFPTRATRPKKIKKKRSRFDYDSSEDDNDSLEFRRQEGMGSVEAEVARRLDKLKRGNSRNSKENEDPRSTKRRKGTTAKRGTKRKLVSKRKTPPPKKICTSLRALDWMWREKSKQFRNAETKLETEASYVARKNVVLHPQFVSAGIVHRLPSLQSFVGKNERTNNTSGQVYDAPRSRHSDLVYAQFCSRLMNCLEGQARLFATCEFFYSDLDREWYNHNTFAAEAAALGVPQYAKLSRDEWRAVRRRMRKKPRRFSKKFIISQLNERNEYRCNVRKLQNNPHLAGRKSFPYNVYAPIRVGTLVTAYSKRFRIIQRGRVLTYDRDSALYLVEFESKQFGYELCPDSEVATCGIPKILIPASTFLDASHEVGIPPSCSATGPPPEPLFADDLKANEGLGDLTCFTPINYDRSATKNGKAGGSSIAGDEKRPRPLLEKIANRDAFITLLEVIDTARNRKSDLLDLIEDANTLMVNLLPNCEDEESSTQVNLSNRVSDHIRWLQKNLARMNQVLAVSMQYMRALYGKAYLPNINAPTGREDISKLLLLQGTLAANNCSESTMPNDWTLALAANSADLGPKLALATQKFFEPQTVKIGARVNLMYDRFCAVGQLLCTASYAQNEAGFVGGADCSRALTVVSKKLSAHEFPSPAGPQQFYSEVLDARDSAVKDLEDALELFRSELELSKLKQSIAS